MRFSINVASFLFKIFAFVAQCTVSMSQAWCCKRPELQVVLSTRFQIGPPNALPTPSTTGAGNKKSAPVTAICTTIASAIQATNCRTSGPCLVLPARQQNLQCLGVQVIYDEYLSQLLDHRWFFNLHLCNVLSDPFPYPPQDCYQLVLPGS